MSACLYDVYVGVINVWDRNNSGLGLDACCVSDVQAGTVSIDSFVFV